VLPATKKKRVKKMYQKQQREVQEDGEIGDFFAAVKARARQQEENRESKYVRILPEQTCILTFVDPKLTGNVIERDDKFKPGRKRTSVEYLVRTEDGKEKTLGLSLSWALTLN
jgi:hypothetical protein